MRQHLPRAVVVALVAAPFVLLLTPIGALSWSAAQKATGTAGSSHAQATKPKRGPRGLRGLRGLKGLKGARGTTGANGTNGVNGANGANGVKGSTGARGPAGGLAVYCAAAKTHPRSYPDAPCRAHPQVVDTTNDVGDYNSMAIGTDGNPVVSYYDDTANSLKITHCTDPLCTTLPAQISIIDDGGGTNDVGQYSSLAIAGDGNPVVSYFDATSFDLKIAHCKHPTCLDGLAGPPDVNTPVSTGFVGLESSLAVGADGNPVVAYWDANTSPAKLYLLKCNDVACAPGGDQANPVAPIAGGANLHASVAIGTDDNPVISYYLTGENVLKVAHCNDPACAGNNETVTTVDPSNAGHFSAIAIGSDGNPVVVYLRGPGMGFAHCTDSSCTGAQLTTIVANHGAYQDVVIGSDGYPTIAYYDDAAGGLMKVMHCNDLACSGGNEQLSTVEGLGFASFVSAAIGIDGLPVVAYSAGFLDTDLKVGRAPFAD
jgi:hypothetical protein